MPCVHSLVAPDGIVVVGAEARVVGRETGHIDDGVGVVREVRTFLSQVSLADFQQACLAQVLELRDEVVDDVVLGIGEARFELLTHGHHLLGADVIGAVLIVDECHLLSVAIDD